MPSRGCFPRTPEPYSEWLGVICPRGALSSGFSCHCLYSSWVLSPLPKPSFGPLSRPLSKPPWPPSFRLLLTWRAVLWAVTSLLSMLVVCLNAFTPPNPSHPHQKADSEFQPDDALPGSCGVEPRAHLCSCLFLNIVVCFISVALAYSVLCTYCKETVGVIFFPVGQAWPHIPALSTLFFNTEKRNFCIGAVLGSAEEDSFFS